MRLTRRDFLARVKVVEDGRIFLSFGRVTFEATISEARDLALALCDAIEQHNRGGGS